MTVRQARPEDVGRLQAIQLAAGNAFRDIGMPAAADTFPLPTESLSGYRRAGRAWVAADEHDEPVGFVVFDVVDGCAHIEQVSVHPAHAGQRIGAMLLEYVADWAVDQVGRIEKERDALQGQVDALSAKLADAQTELAAARDQAEAASAEAAAAQMAQAEAEADAAELRQAEASRKGRGRLARLRAAWRGV